MFIYERGGKLNIMVTGGLPAAEGVTPDIVIEPTDDTPAKAKITVNGTELAVGAYTLPTASATELGGVKIGDGLKIEDGVLSTNA